MKEIQSNTLFLVDVACQRCPSKDWILIEGQPSLCARCKHPIPKYKYSSKDEEHAYRTANDLLMDKDYDLALDAFKQSLKLYPNNPNAVMGLLLAQYKISYDFDVKAQRYIPRNHAIDLPPNIEKELLFKQAIALFNKIGDFEAIKHWQTLAESINQTIKEFNQFAKTSSSCDVFISFKHTEQDELGQWKETKDVVIAEAIYNLILAQGYTSDQVFFSKVDNQHYTGDFEAKIYHKLKTAKLFILIASSYENLESPWVKNEWARYYSMIGNGKKHPESMMVFLENKETYLAKLDSRIKRLNVFDYPQDDFPSAFANLFQRIQSNVGDFSPELSLINVESILSMEDDIFEESDTVTSQVVIDFHDYEVTDLERAKENEMHILWEQGAKDKVGQIANALLASYPRNSIAYQYLFLIEAHIESLDQLSTTSWLNDHGDLQTFFNYMTTLQEGLRRERIEQIIKMSPLAIKEKKPLIYSLLTFLFVTKDLLFDTTVLFDLEQSLYQPCLKYHDLKLFEVILQYNNSVFNPKISELSVKLLEKIPSLETDESLLKFLYQQLKYQPEFAHTFPGSVISKRVLSREGNRLLKHRDVYEEKIIVIFQKIIFSLPDQPFIFRWSYLLIEWLFLGGKFDLANIFIVALQKANIHPEYVVLYKTMSQHKLNKISDLAKYPSDMEEDYLYQLKDKILSLTNKTLSNTILLVVDQYEINKKGYTSSSFSSQSSDILKSRLEDNDQLVIYKPKVFSKIKLKDVYCPSPLFVSNLFFDSIQQESIDNVYMMNGSSLRFKGLYVFKKKITLHLSRGVFLIEGDHISEGLSDMTVHINEKETSDHLMQRLIFANIELLGHLNSDLNMNRLNILKLSNLASFENFNSIASLHPSTLQVVTLTLLPFEHHIEEYIKDGRLDASIYRPLLTESRLLFPFGSLKMNTLLHSAINRSDYSILLKRMASKVETSNSASLLNYAQCLALHPFEDIEPLKVFELLWEGFTLNDLNATKMVIQWIKKNPELLKNQEVVSRLTYFIPKALVLEEEVKVVEKPPAKKIVKEEPILPKPTINEIKLPPTPTSKEGFLDLLNQSSSAIGKSLLQQLIERKKSGDLEAFYILGYVILKGFNHYNSSLEKGLMILEEGCLLGSTDCCQLFLESSKNAFLKGHIPKNPEWRMRIQKIFELTKK